MLVFFYDILVYSASWEEHLDHLAEALGILAEQQLFVNRKKCQFALRQVECLGHVISAQGVSVDPSKVECVVHWPTPKNVKGV